MSGAYTAERVDATIDAEGETATLSRSGEGTQITLFVKRFGSEEVDVAEGVTQPIVTVKIGTAALAGSGWTDKFPKKLDTIVFGGRTRKIIDHPDTRKSGDVTVMHILTVAG